MKASEQVVAFLKDALKGYGVVIGTSKEDETHANIVVTDLTGGPTGTETPSERMAHVECSDRVMVSLVRSKLNKLFVVYSPKSNPLVLHVHRSDKLKPVEEQVADMLWKTMKDVRNMIANSANGSDLHKKVGDLLAAKINGDKTGEKEDNQNALDDTLLCLLRSNNFPLEFRVIMQPTEDDVENIHVVAALTAEEADEAGLAVMVKEAVQIIKDDLGEPEPDEATVNESIVYNPDTDTHRWGSDEDDTLELLMVPVDEEVIAFRPPNKE